MKKRSNKFKSNDDFFAFLIAQHMDLADFTPQQLADMTGCDIKNARRWLKESHGMSTANRKLVELDSQGHIVPEDWRPFFRFINDLLVIDERHHMDLGQLRAYWVYQGDLGRANATIERLQTELVRARHKIRYLETMLEKQQPDQVVSFPAERARKSARFNE